MKTKIVLMGALTLLLCAGAATIPANTGHDIVMQGGSTPFPPDHFVSPFARLAGTPRDWPPSNPGGGHFC